MGDMADWEAGDSIDWMDHVDIEYFQEWDSFIRANAYIPKRTGYAPELCRECGSPNVIKTGKHGLFVGCSNFPKCKARAYTIKQATKAQREAHRAITESSSLPT